MNVTTVRMIHASVQFLLCYSTPRVLDLAPCLALSARGRLRRVVTTPHVSVDSPIRSTMLLIRRMSLPQLGVGVKFERCLRASDVTATLGDNLSKDDTGHDCRRNPMRFHRNNTADDAKVTDLVTSKGGLSRRLVLPSTR